jgi:hypothetical protein
MRNNLIATMIGAFAVLTLVVGSDALAGDSDAGLDSTGNPPAGVAINDHEYYVDSDGLAVPAGATATALHRCDDTDDRLISAGLVNLDVGSRDMSDGPENSTATDGVGWRVTVRADGNGDTFQLRMVCEDLDADN